jgi:hypothetical protein
MTLTFAVAALAAWSWSISHDLFANMLMMISKTLNIWAKLPRENASQSISTTIIDNIGNEISNEMGDETPQTWLGIMFWYNPTYRKGVPASAFVRSILLENLKK